MKIRLSLCLISTFLCSLSLNAADTLSVRLTGKWLRMVQTFEAKNTSMGEFVEVKRDARIRYEARSEGFLSFFDKNKEYADNKVLGVDLPGESKATLVSKNGKVFWQITRVAKNKEGVEEKIERAWEVQFVKGDFKAFENGEDVEAELTTKAQEDWNNFQTLLVVKKAEQERDSYAKQYPSVEVKPVTVEKSGATKNVSIKGNNEKLTVDGSDSFCITKVDVVMGTTPAK